MRSRNPTGSALLPAVLAALVVLSVACSSRPTPQALPPQTLAPHPPESQEEPLSNIEESSGAQLEPLATGIEPTPMPATLESPDEFVMVEEPATTGASPGDVPTATEDDPLTVVLDAGDNEETQPRSLFEASRAEQDRRQQVGESTIVLNNKTLKEYSKGQVTFAEEDEEGEGESTVESAEGESVDIAAEGPGAADEADEAPQTFDEEYWRNRVLDIRISWRDSLDRLEELESEIARLRTEFYAEDDPFYRDAQIKPAWDQALIELEATRRDAQSSQADLEEAMEEGRRAGALPGWLREGIELEPTADELEERLPPEPGQFHEPSEPVILDEDDGDSGGG